MQTGKAVGYTLGAGEKFTLREKFYVIMFASGQPPRETEKAADNIMDGGRVSWRQKERPDLNPLTISLVTFVCIAGGTLAGMRLQSWLPEHHISEESKDVVKLGIGMIATMAALVLGLLIASAKGNFDTMSSEVKQISSRVILLDRTLAHYGPEAGEIRKLLRYSTTVAVERIWPRDKSERALATARAVRVDFEAIQDHLRHLSPRGDSQQWLKTKALEYSNDIAEARWLLSEQIGQSSIPTPFLIILIFWLTIIFASFGLFSPRNATVITVMLICALSAAGALFLIMELDLPWGGLIRVSGMPLRDALAHLGL